MPLVVDASVSLVWCFRDEPGEYAGRILKRLSHDSANVPVHWILEVTNGLIMAVRRERLSAAAVTQMHDMLADLPISIETTTLDEAFGSIHDLGSVHNLTAYDAAYLDLAMRKGLPLATLYNNLRSAAIRAGVPILDTSS